MPRPDGSASILNATRSNLYLVIMDHVCTKVSITPLATGAFVSKVGDRTSFIITNSMEEAEDVVQDKCPHYNKAPFEQV